MDDRPTHMPTARTVAASALGARQASVARALTPAIHVTTTYERDADNGYSSGFVYGRTDNISLQNAEGLIARLEHAAATMLFSSGMAAAAAVILSLAPTRIVVPSVMYYGLRVWLREALRHGHEVVAVDMSDIEAVKAATVPGRTGLVWIETPSNPLWTITDIAAVCECARRAGAITCVDATVSTPILTQPLDLGADFVMHSATKYLNGHSDVVAGALSCARPGEAWTRMADIRRHYGSILSPFDAWLLARGLRTLDLRVRAQSRSAAQLAIQLSGHPCIAAVLYPGLPDHPGHGVAARQMAGGFGGMLSIRLKGDAADAVTVAANVRIWRRATSFGGVESLIEHRSSIEGAGSPCPDDLLRLSVGLEDPEDLRHDLCEALDVLP